jgi:type I restriction enzyme S subunit
MNKTNIQTKKNNLPSGWRCGAIGEFVDLSQGLPINRKTKHLLVETGLPLLRITDLIKDSYSQFVDEEKVPKKCLAYFDDIIYTRTGQVGLVFTNKKGVVHNNCFKVIPKNLSIDKSYLYWFLRQKKITQYSNSIASGSVQKDLNHSAFKTILFNLPPLPEQKAIAHILGKLDDKIALNSQINQTLETMAQTLFKSWFVDFDPVIDNAVAAGNPIPDPLKPQADKRKNIKSTLPKTTQDLFPNSFVFNDKLKKWIPQGWANTKLEEIIDIVIDNRGKTPPSNKYKEIPLVEINSIKGSQRFFANDSIKKYIDLETYNSWFRGHPKKNDVLISTVGSIGEMVLVDSRKFCIAQNIISLRHKNNGVYLLELLKYNRSKIINLDISSVQPSIKVPHLLDMNILNPRVEIADDFVTIATSYSKKIETNILETQTLTKLRDTLLPKLISGKIRI